MDRRRWIVGAAIAPAVVALAGCANTINSGALEREIAANIKQQSQQAATVSCPDDVAAEAGKTFTCTVSAKAGLRAVANITVQGDDGRYAWTIVAAVPGGAATTPLLTTTTPPVTTTPPPATTPTTTAP